MLLDFSELNGDISQKKPELVNVTELKLHYLYY